MRQTVFHENPLVCWHKCDICQSEAYAVYIMELDKWYCTDCIHVVCELLKKLA